MQTTTDRLSDLAKSACALHGADATEGALARLFLERADVGQVRNRLVRTVLSRPAVAEAYEAIMGASGAAIEDLVAAFEVLVPSDEAKEHGAVFTPGPITRFLVNESFQHVGVAPRALDPAVGCGALLVGVLRAIAGRSDQRPADIVANNLFGMDVSEASLDRARILLSLACIALGDDAEKLEFNLYCGDSLLADWGVAGLPAEVDLVIGNPPYVRYQNLPLARRTELSDRYATLSSGNWNLYFAFFELAHRLVRPGGMVAFITPNQFATSLSGGPLREFLAGGRLDAIVDFGTHRVFEALTYTAITFGHRPLDGEQPGVLSYADASGLEGLAAISSEPSAVWRGRGSQVPVSSLSRRPWRLVGPKHADAVSALASTGARLDELADVRYGIATCRDRLYFITGQRDADDRLVKSSGGHLWPIEEAVTRPLVRVPLVQDDAALRANAARVIYPYKLTPDGPRPYDDAELADLFPQAYAYLKSVRTELAARDRGRKAYPQWFAYGRTQGLVPLGDKLLTPLYAAAPRFLRDEDVDDLFVNGCAVAPRAGSDLDVIAAVLRSSLCRYFVEQTGVAIDGGYYAYQKPQLSALSVPDMSTSERSELLAADPAQADALLCELYGAKLPAEYLRSVSGLH